MLDLFRDLAKDVLLEDWRQTGGVIALVLLAAGAVAKAVPVCWRAGCAVVRWLRPKRSEVLQAALGALDDPARTWDGKTLLCSTLEVVRERLGRDGKPTDGEAAKLKITAKSAGRCVFAALSSNERFILDAAIKKVIAAIEREKAAGERALTAHALKGAALDPAPFPVTVVSPVALEAALRVASKSKG